MQYLYAAHFEIIVVIIAGFGETAVFPPILRITCQLPHKVAPLSIYADNNSLAKEAKFAGKDRGSTNNLSERNVLFFTQSRKVAKV